MPNSAKQPHRCHSLSACYAHGLHDRSHILHPPKIFRSEWSFHKMPHFMTANRPRPQYHRAFVQVKHHKQIPPELAWHFRKMEGGWNRINTSIHPYIHTSIHPYIHTSIHPYIHTSIHPYIHTSIHPYIHTSIHPYIHTSIHPYIHTYIHPYIHTSIHPYIHTSIHPYIHTSIHPYIHTSIHPYIHTYIRTYVHTYIHTYIHPYIHTRIHAYTHTRIHAYTHTRIHISHIYRYTYIQTHTRIYTVYVTRYICNLHTGFQSRFGTCLSYINFHHWSCQGHLEIAGTWWDSPEGEATTEILCWDQIYGL